MASPPEMHPAVVSNMEALLRVLTRAEVDPDFRAELIANPFETAYAAGVRISTSDLKSLLGVRGATDRELAEVLRARIAAALRARRR